MTFKNKKVPFRTLCNDTIWKWYIQANTNAYRHQMYSFVKHLFHDIQPLLGRAQSPELLNFLQKLGGIFAF